MQNVTIIKLPHVSIGSSYTELSGDKRLPRAPSFVRVQQTSPWHFCQALGGC